MALEESRLQPRDGNRDLRALNRDLGPCPFVHAPAEQQKDTSST